MSPSIASSSTEVSESPPGSGWQLARRMQWRYSQYDADVTRSERTHITAAARMSMLSLTIANSTASALLAMPGSVASDGSSLSQKYTSPSTV